MAHKTTHIGAKPDLAIAFAAGNIDPNTNDFGNIGTVAHGLGESVETTDKHEG